MTDGPERRTIKSVERAHEIIECLRETDGARLSAIADRVGLTPGSTHTYLSTLRGMGYVVKTDGRYELGPEFVTLGEYVRNHSVLYRAAKEEIDRLAEKTDEAVHLVVEHDGQGIALYERLGEEAIGTEYHRELRQQPHQHLHCTASGKAILAQLSESRVRDVLDKRGMAPQTPNTITDRETFLKELETVREQGYAVNDEEELLGIVAVGASITDGDGEVVGSIAISAPKTRMEEEAFRAELVELVSRAANVTEVNLQTSELRGWSVE
jgi:DNA-binding IclR family transcriptional regulator